MSLAGNEHDEVLNISKDLILVNKSYPSRDALLNEMAVLLYDKGYVKKSFNSALIERENQFPTGLTGRIAGIAIPHTDSNHVNIPALAIATLSEPIQFQAMDDPSNYIDVELVMMMVIKDAQAQLDTLQNIVSILQNDQLMEEILKADDASVIESILIKYLLGADIETKNDL